MATAQQKHTEAPATETTRPNIRIPRRLGRYVLPFPHERPRLLVRLLRSFVAGLKASRQQWPTRPLF